MKIFLAGGFPQMADPVKEKALMNVVLKVLPTHRRLITFWYKKDLDKMLDLKKESRDA